MTEKSSVHGVRFDKCNVNQVMNGERKTFRYFILSTWSCVNSENSRDRENACICICVRTALVLEHARDTLCLCSPPFCVRDSQRWLVVIRLCYFRYISGLGYHPIKILCVCSLLRCIPRGINQKLLWNNKMQHLINLINPETPWGDQHLISPYNINGWNDEIYLIPL